MRWAWDRLVCVGALALSISACGTDETQLQRVRAEGTWTYIDHPPNGGGSHIAEAHAYYLWSYEEQRECLYAHGTSMRIDPGGVGEFEQHNIICDEIVDWTDPLYWSLDDEGRLTIDVDREPTTITLDMTIYFSCDDEVSELRCHDGGTRWTTPACTADGECGEGSICVAMLCVVPESYEPP